MKNIKFIIILIIVTIVVGCLGSCTKKFNELSINPNLPTLEAITTPQQYNQLIQGIYFYIATPRNLGAQARGILFSRGDETSSGSDYAAFGQNSITPDYYSLQEAFQYMYTVVGQATIAIDVVKQVHFTDTVQRNAYLGEAYALRAFAYFFLLTNYRQVSLMTTSPFNPQNVRPVNTPHKVWNAIISDLKKAQVLLPDKGYWTGIDASRLTAGAATALLGKVYLCMSGINFDWGSDGTPINMYNEAAKEFGDIINGKYGHYSLVPDYSWNFDVAHENNDESVWEFAFTGSRLYHSFNPGSTSSAVDFDLRGIVFPYSNHYITSYRSNSSTVVISDWLYNTFLQSKDINGNTDPRMFETMIFNDNDPQIKRPVINGDTLRVTGIDGETWNQMYPPKGNKTGFATINPAWSVYKASNRKWIDLTLPAGPKPASPTLWFGNSYCNGVNYRYIRYAGVLLMYAEAVLDGGTPIAGSASDAINEVRARSNMPPVAATMANLKQERILELSLEGHRFLDLLRWGELDSVMEARQADDPNFKMFGHGSANSTYVPWQPRDEWLPIPSNEMITNPNIKSNNPGW